MVFVQFLKKFKGPLFCSGWVRSNKPLPKYLIDSKLKMSAVTIFEIKGAKRDKIFNFLKGRFSVMRDPMDMIFGVFSETYVRHLKRLT